MPRPRPRRCWTRPTPDGDRARGPESGPDGAEPRQLTAGVSGDEGGAHAPEESGPARGRLTNRHPDGTGHRAGRSLRIAQTHTKPTEWPGSSGTRDRPCRRRTARLERDSGSAMPMLNGQARAGLGIGHADVPSLGAAAHGGAVGSGGDEPAVSSTGHGVRPAGDGPHSDPAFRHRTATPGLRNPDSFRRRPHPRRVPSTGRRSTMTVSTGPAGSEVTSGPARGSPACRPGDGNRACRTAPRTTGRTGGAAS